MSGDLLDKLYQSNVVSNLKEICPSIYTTNVLGEDTIDISYDVSFQDDTLLEYQQLYFNKVEEGNQYIKDLMEIEKQYFTQKYGETIYNYILQQRDDYITNTISSNDGNDSSSNVMNDINYEYNIYKQFYNNGFEKKVDILNENMDMIQQNTTQMENDNELNIRMIEYRKDESNKVFIINRIMTILYYFILLCLFIYLFINDNLYLYKRSVLYLFILFFPLIYKYFFMLLLFLYGKIKNIFNVSGPKNAFVNDTQPLTFLDDKIPSS